MLENVLAVYERSSALLGVLDTLQLLTKFPLNSKQDIVVLQSMRLTSSLISPSLPTLEPSLMATSTCTPSHWSCPKSSSMSIWYVVTVTSISLGGGVGGWVFGQAMSCIQYSFLLIALLMLMSVWLKFKPKLSFEQVTLM